MGERAELLPPVECEQAERDAEEQRQEDDNQHWLIERHGYRTPTEAREHLRAQAAAAA